MFSEYMNLRGFLIVHIIMPIGVDIEVHLEIVFSLNNDFHIRCLYMDIYLFLQV